MIQTYTVDFSRTGSPHLGHIIGRLITTNHRFIANHGDENTLHQLVSRDAEPIGRKGYVKTVLIEEGKHKGRWRNIFFFGDGKMGPKL